ncbi:MAG: hypothetical protein U0271_28590 [Polyangiaceae bacterium]
MSKAKSGKDAKKSPAKKSSKSAPAKAAKAPSKGGKGAGAKAPKSAGSGKRGKGDGEGSGSSAPPPLNPKRKLGLRGAAPWAARHAAKHAAEARARAAEPAPPGSARATIRTPSGAEEIKQKIADLHNQTQKIRTLRKRLDKGFYEIGQLLGDIQLRELFQAKGYGSFEAFLEREIDLGKMTCMRLVRLPTVFQKEAALDYGMERVFAAMSALEGELIPKAIPSAPGSKPGLPLKPPSRLVG